MEALPVDVLGLIFSHLVDVDPEWPYRGVLTVRAVCKKFREVVSKRFAFASLIERVQSLQWTEKEFELAVCAVRAHRETLMLQLELSDELEFFANAENCLLFHRANCSSLGEDSTFDDHYFAFRCDGIVCALRRMSATNGRYDLDEDMSISFGTAPEAAAELARLICTEDISSANDQPAVVPSDEDLALHKRVTELFLSEKLDLNDPEHELYLSALVSLLQHRLAGNGNIIDTWYGETPSEMFDVDEYIQTIAEGRARIMLDSRVVLRIGAIRSTGYSDIGEEDNKVVILAHGLPIEDGNVIDLLDHEEALAYVRDHYFPDAENTEELLDEIFKLDNNISQVIDELDGSFCDIELPPRGKKNKTEGDSEGDSEGEGVLDDVE